MQPVGEVMLGHVPWPHELPAEEIDRRDRDSREGDAVLLLDQLPPAFRKRWGDGRLERSCHVKLVEAARAWRADASFLVLGDSGVGKSTAAAWLFRRIVIAGIQRGGPAWERARTARWYPAVELERARLEHKLGVGEAPEVARAQGASVLVIDDAGQDRDASAIRKVLGARYDAGLPTILSTNLRQAELVAHYGGAFVRKLVQSGGKRAAIVNLWPKTGTP